MIAVRAVCRTHVAATGVVLPMSRSFHASAASLGPKTGVKKPSVQRQFDTSATPSSPYQREYQALDASDYTGDSTRVGVVALKCGMMPEWDRWGVRVPLTVLKLEDVRVTQVKTSETDGYTALQVGGGDVKPKKVKKAQEGHFKAGGVTPKAAVAEFRVSEDALLPVGTPILAKHFVPGQFVDIQGKSQGKGFQGVMKRYGFGGQPATHGVSKVHRSMGSTGQCQDPGRVWKGKKMPGRMGGKNVTVEGLQVYKIDVKRNLLFVKGAVPGTKGSVVKVKDSRKKTHKTPPPFPTYVATTKDDEEVLQRWSAGEGDKRVETGSDPFEVVMPAPSIDPFAIQDWEEGEA